MTITLIILIITVAMFIWGKVRADIVALTALADSWFSEFLRQPKLWLVSLRPLSS